jgi:hypothetical protein
MSYFRTPEHQGLASRVDPALATVGEIHRAEVRSG